MTLEGEDAPRALARPAPPGPDPAPGAGAGLAGAHRRAGAWPTACRAATCWLSPDHALHFDGWLIPAKALRERPHHHPAALPPHVTYYHVELDAHAVIFAEHAAVESYLDTGNRGMFENAARPLALHPDFAVAQALRLRRSCLPFTEDLAVVARVRRQIWHRSAFVADRTG